MTYGAIALRLFRMLFVPSKPLNSFAVPVGAAILNSIRILDDMTYFLIAFKVGG